MKKILLSILLAVSAASMAQTQLDQVVVTGTRTPKLLKDVPVPTRVITSSELEKADATNIQDLLQQEIPGIEFSYSMNQQVHMNMSGFAGQGILFLVDGERLAGETMDDVDFTRLNLNNVERIEIIRGAASALYGSNAGGGVINIITKDGTDPFSLDVSARYAPRHNNQRYDGRLALANKHVSNVFGVNYNSQDNFDVSNAPNPATTVVSTIYGGRTINFKDQFTWKPFQRLKLSARAGYFYRTVTRSTDTPERYRDFTGGLRGTWKITDHDNLDISYSFDQYDKSDYQRITGLDIRDYSNVQNSLRALYSHNFQRGDILTVGADYMYDYLMNVNMDASHRQSNFDIFAQYDWQISRRWEFVGAFRYDYFSAKSLSRVTPKLNVCYKAPKNLTFRAGYGMGFRAPTLKEMYYNFDMSGIWIIEGNPDLKPEVSHNFNLSAEWTRKHLNLTGSLYYNLVVNKLTTGLPYYKPGDSRQLYLGYINLSRFHVWGAELTAQTRWTGRYGTISGKASYAFTKESLGKTDDGETINNQYIPARPHTLTVSADWDRQFTPNYGLDVILTGRVLSGVDNVEYKDIYDTSQGRKTVHYPAYTIWKLMVVQRIFRKVSITATIDNLFNYNPTYHYLNSPLTDGINAMVGISVKM